jgi:thiol-disulfide isomerase/thioredoxin
MKHTFSVFLLILTFCLSSVASFAQKGFKIKAKLENYPTNELVLGFHYGDKQYVKDTVSIGSDGYFTFQADTLMPCGVYLLVLKPDNNFIQILMDADQDFMVETDVKDIVGKMKVKGSDDNQHFYEYLKYLADLRPKADTLKAQLDRNRKVPADSIRLINALGDLDKDVKKYQASILKKHPNTMTSKIVNAALETTLPDFEGTDEKELQRKRYLWYKAHYFDNIDIADPCMLRGPVLHGKVDYYMTKLTPQHPDSLCKAVDYILDRTKSSQENFKYFLIQFLNTYAKSNIVGFDAVYVHIVKKYYEKGLAPWTKKEDLDKIIDNANRLEPILIGKIAPNITVKTKENKPISLWDVDADYTVLFFWDPECGHCKKAAPFMVEFANKFKDRGVKIFSVCTAVTDKAPDCWKSIEEKGFSDFLFLNTYDPYIQSKYKTLYDVRTTPQIFILDRKHEILMKRISGEQMSEVMEQVMGFQEEKKKGGK